MFAKTDTFPIIAKHILTPVIFRLTVLENEVRRVRDKI